MTIALFQQSGTRPSRKDKFNINVITGVSTSTDCFTRQVGIGSRLHVAFNEATIILMYNHFLRVKRNCPAQFQMTGIQHEDYQLQCCQYQL